MAAIVLAPLLFLAPILASAANLTADQGAGPLYRGRDLPFFLEALPGQNVSFSDGKAARGWLQVPNRSNSTGAVCAKGWQNPPLAAQVVCRALGWTGVARAAGAPAPENSTTIGPEGVSWESLRCDGTEAGPLGCRYKPVEVNFTGCLPRARLVIECYQDPGTKGELRFREPPPAASEVSEMYGRGLTVEVFHRGFWGYVGTPLTPNEAVVLCREAGYGNGTAGTGDVQLAGLGYREAGGAPTLALACNGSEAAVQECAVSWVPPLPISGTNDTYFDWVPRGSISYYTSPLLPLLFCPPAFNDTHAELDEVEDGALRLAYGGLPATAEGGCVKGEAQIRAGGYWGMVTLGDYGAGAEDVAAEVAQSNAQVICRELGAPTTNVTSSLAAPSSDILLPVWLTDLECGGEEESILDCAFSSSVVPGGAPPAEGEAVYALEVSCCPQ